MRHARWLGISLLIVSTTAQAAEREGPIWCGKRLAAIDAKGVVVWDGKRTQRFAFPPVSALAFDPKCATLAVAGEHLGAIDLASRKVTDFGAPPSPATDTRVFDGSRPSIVWTRSGSRFAVAYFGGRIRWRDVVFAVTPSSASVKKLPAPAGEVSALGWRDDSIALVAVAANGSAPASLYRVSTTGKTFVDDFDELAFGPSGETSARRKDEAYVVDALSGKAQSLASSVAVLIGNDGQNVLLALNAPTGQGLPFASIPIGGGTLWKSSSGSWGYPGTTYWGFAPSAQRVAGGARDGSVHAKADRAELHADDGKRSWRVWDAGSAGSEIDGKGRTIEHVRIAPDGHRAALLIKVGEGALAGHGKWRWKWRQDLVVADLDHPGSAKTIATVRRDVGWAVD